jgi:hypothetical protein
MDELIHLVTQKAGIPADKAQLAVTTVIGFLKTRLPAPIATHLDALVAGDTSGLTSGLGDVTKNLGGMLGGQADRPTR